MSVAVASFIMAGLFAVGGLLSIMASIANWDWFFKSESVRMLTWKLSRPWQRIVYAILGIAIIAMSVMVLDTVLRL